MLHNNAAFIWKLIYKYFIISNNKYLNFPKKITKIIYLQVAQKVT